MIAIHKQKGRTEITTVHKQKLNISIWRQKPKWFNSHYWENMKSNYASWGRAIHNRKSEEDFNCSSARIGWSVRVIIKLSNCCMAPVFSMFSHFIFSNQLLFLCLFCAWFRPASGVLRLSCGCPAIFLPSLLNQARKLMQTSIFPTFFGNCIAMWGPSACFLNHPEPFLLFKNYTKLKNKTIQSGLMRSANSIKLDLMLFEFGFGGS